MIPQAPLSDTDRQLLTALARHARGGLRREVIWALDVAFVGLAILTWMEGLERGELLMAIGLCVLLAAGVCFFHAALAGANRQVGRWTAELAQGHKHVLRGADGAVTVEGHRLRYRVGGQYLAVQPVLTRHDVLLSHLVLAPKLINLAAPAGLAIELEASITQGALLSLHYPALPPELEQARPLEAEDRRLLRRLDTGTTVTIALIAAVLGAVVVGAALWFAAPHEAIPFWIWALWPSVMLPLTGLMSLLQFFQRRSCTTLLDLRGPVTEVLHAGWREMQQRHMGDTMVPVASARRGLWVRVGRHLIPCAHVDGLALGARVQVRAALGAHGLPLRVLSLEVLPHHPAPPRPASPAHGARPRRGESLRRPQQRRRRKRS